MDLNICKIGFFLEKVLLILSERQMLAILACTARGGSLKKVGKLFKRSLVPPSPLTFLLFSQRVLGMASFVCLVKGGETRVNFKLAILY